MAEKRGVKELSELVKAMLLVVELGVEQFADGFQAEDLPVLFSKLALDPRVQKGFKGLSALKGEVGDLDLQESIQLSMVILQKVPDIMKKVK